MNFCETNCEQSFFQTGRLLINPGGQLGVSETEVVGGEVGFPLSCSSAIRNGFLATEAISDSFCVEVGEGVSTLCLVRMLHTWSSQDPPGETQGPLDCILDTDCVHTLSFYT